jgi:hypothetical protein
MDDINLTDIDIISIRCKFDNIRLLTNELEKNLILKGVNTKHLLENINEFNDIDFEEKMIQLKSGIDLLNIEYKRLKEKINEIL